MGFALKLAKVDKGEIDEKVEEAAKILDLTEHLDRKPANLSGGQRQRVAMGRAIVRDPRAFLMDEPLSNLDAKLRVQMRTEVSRIQQRLGTTTVYVTHDQTEAMTLGDRVAVMRSGRAAAGRGADGALQRPQEPVRGRLHRLARDELHAGEARGRHAQAPDGRRAAAAGAAREAGALRRRTRRDRRRPAGGLRGRLGWSATPRTAAPPSRPRSTCWSRWAPSSTPTSRSTTDQADRVRGAARAGRGLRRRRGPGRGRGGPDRGPARRCSEGRGGRRGRAVARRHQIKLFDPPDGRSLTAGSS